MGIRYPEEIRKYIIGRLMQGCKGLDLATELISRFPERFNGMKPQSLSGTITGYKKMAGLKTIKYKRYRVPTQKQPEQPRCNSATELLTKAMVIYLKTGHIEKAKAVGELL